MNEHEEIELQLWEYIDGQCTKTDKQRMSALIVTDMVWKNKYKELIILNESIAQLAEKEEPSMRFTKNVMEAVAATNVARPTNLYINRNIIRGIAAFFILMVSSMLIFAFITAKTTGKNIIDLNGALTNLKNMAAPVFSSSLLQCVLWVNVILGLLLFDSILRKRHMQHKHEH